MSGIFSIYKQCLAQKNNLSQQILLLNLTHTNVRVPKLSLSFHVFWESIYFLQNNVLILFFYLVVNAPDSFRDTIAGIALTLVHYPIRRTHTSVPTCFFTPKWYSYYLPKPPKVIVPQFERR